MRLEAHGGTGPLPHPASHRIPCWVAGWGSGPVPPRKSLFRDFPNSLSAALSGAIEIDRRTDERFQRLLVDRVAFMDIDRAADVAVEARIEQPGRIGERDRKSTRLNSSH